MSHFTQVLRNRNFFLLWLGQIISQLGDRLSQMALIGLVYVKAPGSSMQIAKILSFTIIPVFLIGPIAGAYVDRWNRRQTMYICDFLRTGLILLIPLFLVNRSGFIWIYAIIFLAFSIGRFFVPAKLSIVPQLVPKADLLIANSLINTTGMIAAVLGFGVSGVIVERWGAEKGFYLDSLSFLVSGTLIFLVSLKNHGHINLNVVEFGQEIVGRIKKSIVHDIAEGVVYFIREKSIRFTAGIMFLLFSALGSVYVVSIVFIQQALGSATKDLGLIIMFLGIGLFLGSLLYGKFGHRLSQYKIIFSSLAGSGIMLVAFALGIQRYPVFGVAALLSVLLGMAIAPIMIASNTIVHKASANHMMGKTFSSLEIVMHLGFICFMFLSSRLAEVIAPGIILVSVGIVVCSMGLANLIVTHKVPWLD